ncbi:MAG: 4-(cytidine 5'-diphospho)-2-C-methyl-D-erythritol kinase [Candidatus Zixiibacteriota bacterium]
MLVRNIGKAEVTIDTPAKVNLFLQVLNKRPDGYHNINSLFQAVSLCDSLRFCLSDKPDVSIDLRSDSELTLKANNLITETYRLLKQHFGLSKGLSVRLEKRIPVAAGLGGGSSNAAATILACDLLFHLNLSYPEMAALAMQIGSDVPFFFYGGQALVTGRGEKVVATDFPTEYKMVLACTKIAISTGAAYAALKMDLTRPKSPFRLVNIRTLDEFVESLLLSGNDFEEIQLRTYPELGKIREFLLKQGALMARMSGSGPTMFGIFRETSPVESVKPNERDWRLYTVVPISLPRQDQLVTGRHRGDYGDLGEPAGQTEA